MQIGSAANAPTPGLIHPLTSILDRVNLDQLFPSPQPLEIELGSGDGSFLVQYAREHPEHNFIGVERLLGRMRKLDRKGRQAGLTNLRGVRIESSYFLRYLLPRHSAAALHIYFPDPWPKRKHWRHRLINEEFPAIAHEALKPSGRVYLRTDHADYFQQMLNIFASSPLFSEVAVPATLAACRTDFEMEFNARGVTTLGSGYEARAAG